MELRFLVVRWLGLGLGFDRQRSKPKPKPNPKPKYREGPYNRGPRSRTLYIEVHIQRALYRCPVYGGLMHRAPMYRYPI